MTSHWTSLDVPAIAAALATDESGSWAQASAWERAFSVLNTHAAKVRIARDKLTESWPPEKSPAANAYMIRLDNLIASLTDSANAAIANRDALVGVLTALALARTRVQVLHEAWQEYSRRDNSWHSFTGDGVVAITSPPGWAQDLNAKAHAVTAELDQTVFEYSQRFIPVQAVGPISDHYQPINLTAGSLTHCDVK